MVWTFGRIGSFQEDGPELPAADQWGYSVPEGVQVVRVLHGIGAGIAAIEHVEAGGLDEKCRRDRAGMTEGKRLDGQRRVWDGIFLGWQQAPIDILLQLRLATFVAKVGP